MISTPPPVHRLANAHAVLFSPVFPQINDRLEFPVELNMYPYTNEGREATATTNEEAGHPQDAAGNDAGDDGAKVGGAKEAWSVSGVGHLPFVASCGRHGISLPFYTLPSLLFFRVVTAVSLLSAHELLSFSTFGFDLPGSATTEFSFSSPTWYRQ